MYNLQTVYYYYTESVSTHDSVQFRSALISHIIQLIVFCF